MKGLSTKSHDHPLKVHFGYWANKTSLQETVAVLDRRWGTMDGWKGYCLDGGHWMESGGLVPVSMQERHRGSPLPSKFQNV